MSAALRLVPSGTAEASGGSALSASRAGSVQASSPVVVATSRRFVTAGSTARAREVQTALENEFDLSTERAQLLATTLMNSGAGVTDGTKLMHALQMYGEAAFFWIYDSDGCLQKKGAASSISTMTNQLAIWRGHCSDISDEVRCMADRWTEVPQPSVRNLK
jgi:hypothetical protein